MHTSTEKSKKAPTVIRRKKTTLQPLRDDGKHADLRVHRAGTEPTNPPAPVPQAKVKVDIVNQTDADALQIMQRVVTAMTDNPNFPNPKPVAAVFNTAVETYASYLNQAETMRLMLKQLVTDKDRARVEAEQLLNLRAAYVETTSGGDASKILSAGFEVRNAPTPTGVLPPPLGLHVELNGTAGDMKLTWNKVPKARSFNAQFSEVNGAERNWHLLPPCPKRRLNFDGEVGRTYAFRVAAVGGSTGQSAWCPEVIRAAA